LKISADALFALQHIQTKYTFLFFHPFLNIVLK